MKFKSVPLLAVTIAGTAMMLAACQAQSSPTQEAPGSSAQTQNTEVPDSSNPPGPGRNGSMRGAYLPPELKLTDEQKTKIKEIQENYRSKMENIFTDEQKNQLKAARGQGRKGMQSLNLTDAQKQQIRDLMQSQRQEMDNVLTAEQKQQLQKMRQNRQRRPKPEDSPASQGQ